LGVARHGMNREKLDGWCERGILILVLGVLVFGPLAMGAVGVWQFLVLEGLTLGVMALWALRIWVSPKPQLLWPPICWVVLAFVGYAVARYLQADIEYVARKELIRVLVYAFLFFAILNNLHRQELIQVMVLTLAFLGMAISFYAIYQFATKSTLVWGVKSPYPGRAGGTFVYPNNLAGFLEMIVPLGLSCLVLSRLSHVTKIYLGYATLVMLAGIGVTVSRGGWLVTGVVLILFCCVLFTQQYYRIQALALAAILVAGGTFLLSKAQFMQARLENGVKSGAVDDLRFSLWQPAYKMWQDHFWWGVGPGLYDYRFRQYRPPDVQLRPGHAHNDYLNTLADWGLAGTVLVAGAFVALGWGVAKTWRAVRGARDDFARKPSNKFAVLIGAVLGLTAILLHSFGDFNMHVPANAILAVALMALLSSQWRFATERYWFSMGAVLKCAVTLALVAGLGCLAFEGARKASEFAWLRQAGQYPRYSFSSIAALTNAFRVEPMNFETSYTIGECYRMQSWDGADDYVPLAREAMQWYQRGMKLNPHDGYNWLRYGMCLDWMGAEAPEKADAYYERANELDPNGYFTTANTGWHYIEIRDFAAAVTWFERSQRLAWEDNEIARQYRPIAEQRLKEAAQANNGQKGEGK
jgi:O-antigen ligase